MRRRPVAKAKKDSQSWQSPYGCNSRPSVALETNVGIAENENGMLAKVIFERDQGGRLRRIREAEGDRRHSLQPDPRPVGRQQDPRAVGASFLPYEQRRDGNARRCNKRNADIKMVDRPPGEIDPRRIYAEQVLGILNVDGVKLQKLEQLAFRERCLQGDFAIDEDDAIIGWHT